MSYDENLATKIRIQLKDLEGLSEKKMFGGLSFLLHGNMVCGILGQDLIIRVGRERYAEVLQQPHTREFDLTGKTMKGWVTVEPAGCTKDDALRRWLRIGVEYAGSLPAK